MRDENVMKSKGLKKLTLKQAHTLPYLVSCSSYEEAARQAGVSVKQIYCWLKIPFFDDELQRQRNAIFVDSMKALKAASKKAVATLVDCLNDFSIKNRISAADKILSHALRAVELYEVEERLGRVEKRIEQALEKQGSSEVSP